MDSLMAYLEQLDWLVFSAALGRILLILILMRVVIAISRRGLCKLEQYLVQKDLSPTGQPAECSKRAQTLSKLLLQGITILVWLTGVLVIMRELGMEIGPIMASAGIAGVALGFGAQNLVRDIISGFFMILENQVRVGDVAIVNGTGGLVEEVNLRTIVLRDLAGIKHFFPNGTITSLANVTQEWSAYVFEIGVDYAADIDKAIELMRQVGTDLRADAQFGPLMIEDIEIFGVDDFADSAVVIKGRLRTRPIKQWDVGREYRRRLKKVFDAEGIVIPFPQRTVHMAAGSTALAGLDAATLQGS